MNQNIIYIFLLSISTILMFFVNNYIKKTKKGNQLTEIFSVNFILIMLWNVSLILQIFFSKNEFINPIWFDYIAYIGISFLPVSLLFTGKIFANTKIQFTRKYLFLFIVPILSLLVLWTNDIHHLFYKFYSTNINNCIYGPYIYVHHLYSYLCMFIGILYLIMYSIKNSGFFSKQSLLIIIGISISLSINILGSFQIIPISIYITPISFTIAILLIAFGIFKFDFLKVVPIALQRIVDRMSDGYIVVNDENIVTDFNQTFLELFSLKTSELRNININDLIIKLSNNSEKRHTFLDAINKTKSDDTTIKIESYFSRVK